MSEPVDPDVPPRRFEQRGGWKYLIQDEQEWLARPASWGIEKLAEGRAGGKRILFDHHYYGRIADWISCPVCRPLVKDAFAEDGIRTPDVLVVPRENFNFRGQREAFREWYNTLHPAGHCEAWDCVRVINFYEIGILTLSELHNRLVENLCEVADRLGREQQTLRYRQTRAAWDRELALELVGPNPFRPVAFDAAWRSDTAVSLAKHIYESRDFSAMPILADALQDAGCDSGDVLDHCRGSGPHVRGCWVVDLVLGKG